MYRQFKCLQQLQSRLTFPHWTHFLHILPPLYCRQEFPSFFPMNLKLQQIIYNKNKPPAARSFSEQKLSRTSSRDVLPTVLWLKGCGQQSGSEFSYLPGWRCHEGSVPGRWGARYQDCSLVLPPILTVRGERPFLLVACLIAERCSIKQKTTEWLNGNVEGICFYEFSAHILWSTTL